MAQFYRPVKQKLLVALRQLESRREWAVGGSQDNIYEESHDGRTDQPGDGNRYKPGDEDVPEQTPVH